MTLAEVLAAASAISAERSPMLPELMVRNGTEVWVIKSEV